MNRFWRWMQNKAKSKVAKRRPRRLQLEYLDARRVLASAYQNPGQVFDVNNDTYVDQEDIRLSEVRLASRGEGQLPTTRDHHLIPFYDVNGDGAFTKQDIADLRKQIQQGPATTSFKLANDSGDKLDRTTNDVRIVGRVMNFDSQSRVFAWFGGGRWSRVDVTNLIARDGSFQFTIHDLHRINGRLFTDGAQTMFMQSYNRQVRTSGVVDYAFTIDRKGPAAFNLLPMEVQRPLGSQPAYWIARWTQVDAKSYDLRITSDAAGKNTVRYEHDLNEYYNSTQFTIRDLPAGTYYVWMTGFDESGNRTEAVGSGQQATWSPESYIVRDPVVDPVRMETVLVDGVPTDTWKVTLTTYDLRAFQSQVVVTRDRAGTDVVYEHFLSHDYKEVSLTHLEKGVYYITVSQYKGGQNVPLFDHVEVNWNPRRPDDFSVDRPGFVIGDSLDLNWEAAAGAVRYDVILRKAETPKDVFRGSLLFTKFEARDKWAEQYPRTYNQLVGNYAATTNHLQLQNLQEGQYVVEVVAYDAQGRRTLSRNVSEFSVDANGLMDNYNSWAYQTIGRMGDRVSIWASPTLSGLARTRIEIYTSASFSPESLLLSHDSTEAPSMDASWATLKAYPKIFIKVSFFDYKDVKITIPQLWVIDPAEIEEFHATTGPVGFSA